MAKQIFSLQINDREYEVFTEPNRTLLEVVRDELRLTGAKEGCGTGDCGACTMIVDGRAITSCLMLAPDAAGRSVRTIEGLAANGTLHPLQQAFIDHFGSISQWGVYQSSTGIPPSAARSLIQYALPSSTQDRMVPIHRALPE